MKKNSIGRGEPTLCASQVPQRRLIINNGGGNFVPISWPVTQKNKQNIYKKMSLKKNIFFILVCSFVFMLYFIFH
jgi:hypothetical protein